MNEEITFWIYGDVGTDVEAEPIVRALAAADSAAGVVVRINSAGGSVAEGTAIYNVLSNHPGPVRVEIDGLAASMAGYIAMAGDTVVMADNALLMIHSPWAATDGNADQLRKSADTLDKVEHSMIAAYRNKSHLPENRIRQIMKTETWYTAEEALEAGFVDEIAEGLAIAASVDLSLFNNVPKRIMEHHAMAKQADKAAGAANAATTDHTAQTAVLDFQAKERQRRGDIREAFRMAMSTRSEESRPRFEALQSRCLEDFSCDIGIARERLMNELGRGCEPLSGGVTHADDTVFAQYGPGSTVSMSGRSDAFMAAARDALLMQNGIAVSDPHPAARDFANARISELADICLSRAGKRQDFGASAADKIKAAAQTTSDFPNILENVVNKSLIDGLDTAGIATHRGTWTKPGNLADFKDAKRVAMSEAPDLKQVDEAGEITHGNILDGGAETIRAETYARIISASRQAVINDDLEAFTKIPRLMGQSAARREADQVYGILADNPAMRDGAALFHSNHGNLAATGAAITVDALGAARAAMRKQRGVAGKSYLNVTPAFLICGADRETEALKVLAQLTPSNAGDVTPQWIQQLTLVVDPRCDDMDNSAWFLSANPAVHDTVEVAYLDGRRAPALERQEDFNTLNLSWRAVFDFGAAALDWRGLHKNPGAV